MAGSKSVLCVSTEAVRRAVGNGGVATLAGAVSAAAACSPSGSVVSVAAEDSVPPREGGKRWR